MRRFIVYFVAILALALAGCASVPPRVPLAPGAVKVGELITVVQAPEPKDFIIYAPHPGMAFGLIGGAIAGAQMASRATTVQTLVKGEGFAVNQELAHALQRELESAGYRAEILAPTWVEKDGKLTLSLDSIKQERILLLWPNMVGFWATGMTEPYQPVVRGRIALFGKDRNKPLYSVAYAGGAKLTGDNWLESPATGAGFANFDALVASPRSTVDSLRTTVDGLAKLIVADMRR